MQCSTIFRTVFVVFIVAITANGWKINKIRQPILRAKRLRQALVNGWSSVFLIGTMFVAPVFAAELATFKSDRYHTSFSYPSNWEMKVGQLSGERTVTAFTDPSDPTTSASIVFTPIPADYTRLTSFGGKETVRQYLLPAGEGIEANIVDEKVKGENYFLEYVVSAPSAPTRHVQTVFALRPQESVVGLTIQSKEENYAKNKEIFTTIMPSLKVDLDN